MKINIKSLLGCCILLSPFFAMSQVTPQKDTLSQAKKDSLSRVLMTDSLAIKDSTIGPKKDTIIVTDTVVAVLKSCYTEWYDALRTRGAKPVPDGMQQVVIALKNEESCHCFMGQVEVVGGKIKPPLFFQQENGDYKQ